MGYIDFKAREIGYKNYDAYLQSTHWYVFSLKYRDKKCFCCGIEKEHLQVHHAVYDRLGREWPTDVVTVCGPCHLEIHSIAKNGAKLEDAHFILSHRLRKPKQKPEPQRKQHPGFVTNWRKLLDRSVKSRNIRWLEEFLVEKGLLLNSQVTTLAREMGFVKTIDDREMWCVRKYVSLYKSDKRIRKLIRERKFIPRRLTRHALIFDIENFIQNNFDEEILEHYISVESELRFPDF
jgi:hypothetical protein